MVANDGQSASSCSSASSTGKLYVMSSIVDDTNPIIPSSIRGRIVVDTGSGVHIVGRDNIKSKSHSAIYTGPPYRLNTANGQIDTSECINVGSSGMHHSMRACVLNNSPNVLSVGKLCADGWTFHWKGDESIMVRPQIGSRKPKYEKKQTPPVLVSPGGRS